MSSEELSVFQQCVVESNSDEYSPEVLVECIANKLENAQTQLKTDSSAMVGIDFLFIIAGSLVFFMQTGFAMLCAGCVRKKNAQNTMLKNLLDACGAAIAYFAVGYAFSFGGQNETADTTFIGTKGFFSTGEGGGIDFGFWFFQYTFAAATVTIVAGTLAERCQMLAYLMYSVFLTGFVYPVVAHSIWSNNGFLSGANAEPIMEIGMVDFAGSGVVHLTGGTTALIATWVLGSRRGRFFDMHTGKALETPHEIKGHSISLQLLGTMCLWFGWYGFNPGSALLLPIEEYRGEIAARAAVNTSLAASSGGIAALFTRLYLDERRSGEWNFDLVVTMNGCLSGLVAITAGCGVVENWAAVIIGVFSGWIYIWGSAALINNKIDDAVDAIPVHMFNGAWGLISTGLFASPGPMLKAYGVNHHVGWLFSIGDGHLLACQVLGLIFIIAWTFMLMMPFFLFLNWMGWFRTESVQELVGLDISYHGRHELENNEDDDEMKDEYLDAYERYKSNIKQRRGPQQDLQEKTLSVTDAVMDG